jgi:hypothetical protein
VKPTWVTLVPESREELTTQGGLDAIFLQGMLNTVALVLIGLSFGAVIALPMAIARWRGTPVASPLVGAFVYVWCAHYIEVNGRHTQRLLANWFDYLGWLNYQARHFDC